MWIDFRDDVVFTGSRQNVSLSLTRHQINDIIITSENGFQTKTLFKETEDD
jgi:hypothetical protein